MAPGRVWGPQNRVGIETKVCALLPQHQGAGLSTASGPACQTDLLMKVFGKSLSSIHSRAEGEAPPSWLCLLCQPPHPARAGSNLVGTDRKSFGFEENVLPQGTWWMLPCFTTTFTCPRAPSGPGDPSWGWHHAAAWCEQAGLPCHPQEASGPTSCWKQGQPWGGTTLLGALSS